MSRTVKLAVANALAFTILTAGLFGTPRSIAPGPVAESVRPSAAPAQTARESYGQIPLSFEANRGQTDESVNFLARGAGYALFLKPTEAVFVLGRQGAAQADTRGRVDSDSAQIPHPSSLASPPAVLRMQLVGADAGAAVEGDEELAGKVNYFNGDDPSKWRTDVSTFGRVRYNDVYAGVDLVYYGNQRQLEYDFVVAPGADPRVVSLTFDGADQVELDREGNLLLTLGEAVVRQLKPYVYQEVAGGRREVESGYTVGENEHVGFRIGAYDPALPLIIDPVIVYSTYLGASGGDQAWGVAVDSTGQAYLTGFTTSTTFPTANAVQAANGGFQDAFVTKLNAAGTALVYSTYLGGNGNDQARAIAVDSSGNVYVTGFTGSTNFPTANAFQAAQGAGNNQDVFVTKLNAAGSALVYSSYLGGDGALEFGEGIAVDSAGNAYLAGVTNSTNFPTANAIQAVHAGGGDVFLTKLNAAGSALVYSTYLGGSNFDLAEGIAVDSSGNAYLTGDTASTNYPTANSIQAAHAGGRDGLVTKVNAAGTALVYSTYLGGSADDQGESVAIDSAGNAYVTGTTESTNFPTANALQPANGGTSIFQDAFVTKLNAAGNAFVYSTYLGGTGGEVGHGIAVDSSGNAYVAGGTGSNSTFPTANAIQCTRAGGTDVFVTKVNSAGNALAYSTYIGGSGSGTTIEIGRGIGVDSAGNAYVTGGTDSTNFPTVNPIQSTYAGSDFGLAGDAFVLKLSDANAGPASQLQLTQTTPSVQEDVTFVTLTVQRTGDLSGTVTVDYRTVDGTASERADYTTALGTLRFAVGESAKTITLLVNEDSKVEGNETFTLALSNATGGATLSCPTATATVTITDDAVEPATNAIDDATIFVATHYHDFLNRQHDDAGLAFWVNQLTNCGNPDPLVCRIHVSAAFFLSIEFQATGFYAIRMQRVAFGRRSDTAASRLNYEQFLRDSQRIGAGVIIGQPGAEQLLEANRQAYAEQIVLSAEFIARFPTSQNAAQYVDALYASAVVTPSANERQAAIDAFGMGGTAGRVAALRTVTDSTSVRNAELNPAFVLMQYFGYLRRDPTDPPDASDVGYQYWLTKLNSHNGNFIQAEMVKAFLVSVEYRQRFGP